MAAWHRGRVTAWAGGRRVTETFRWTAQEDHVSPCPALFGWNSRPSQVRLLIHGDEHGVAVNVARVDERGPPALAAVAVTLSAGRGR